MRATNRRQFLCVTAGLGGAAALAAAGRLFSLGTSPGAAPDELGQADLAVSHTALALGSDVSITVLHPDRVQAERAVDAAFAELALVERLMSIYRPDSQLSLLNRQEVLENPHPYLVEVLEAAQRMSAASAGAFDITVQPLWSLFAVARRSGHLPDAQAIQQARQAVDWRRVEVTPTRIRLHGRQTAITLNGIAQGFATDRAGAALATHGMEHALIHGGEIGALGAKTDGQSWSVGIQHPRQQDAYISLAGLADRSLATSGDYATSFSDDLRFNHLFDPRTGRSPESLASVSVAAPTAMLADALSTALFVLGPDDGLRLVSETAGADALLVSKDGMVRMTAGFPATA